MDALKFIFFDTNFIVSIGQGQPLITFPNSNKEIYYEASAVHCRGYMSKMNRLVTSGIPCRIEYGISKILNPHDYPKKFSKNGWEATANRILKEYNSLRKQSSSTVL